MTIHYCYWAGQPYVYLSCAPKTGRYVWVQPNPTLPSGVYECDGDKGPLRYTFDADPVTCPACLIDLQNHSD